MAETKEPVYFKTSEVIRSEIATAMQEERPVNVYGIIGELGIRIKVLPLGKGISGYLGKEGGTYEIGINSAETSGMQRFIAARELGYYVIYRDRLDYQGRSYRNDEISHYPLGRDAELEAMRYALTLIMPSEYVRLLNEKYDGDFKVISKTLNVSEPAIVIRLKTLGLMANTPADSATKSTKEK